MLSDVERSIARDRVVAIAGASLGSGSSINHSSMIGKLGCVPHERKEYTP